LKVSNLRKLPKLNKFNSRTLTQFLEQNTKPNKCSRFRSNKLFQDIVTKNGDFGKTISYFKVDIEGMEIDAFADWIDSGMMNYVKQVSII
jgi:hypothetical protein